MQSIFHTLEVESIRQCGFATRQEARRALFACIEGHDNRQRLHCALGHLTLEQAEWQATV